MRPDHKSFLDDLESNKNRRRFLFKLLLLILSLFLFYTYYEFQISRTYVFFDGVVISKKHIAARNSSPFRCEVYIPSESKTVHAQCRRSDVPGDSVFVRKEENAVMTVYDVTENELERTVTK